MRKIAMGNNLGNEKSMLCDTDDAGFYCDNLESIIDNDIYIKIALIRWANILKLVNELFRKWKLTEGAKELNATDIWNKKLELLKIYHQDEYNNICLKAEELKKTYHFMFKKLADMRTIALHQCNASELKIEDGKVDLTGRTILTHNIPLCGNKESDIAGFESRKELGIIASEWFGKLEKYGECRFCASFIKANDDFFNLNSDTLSNQEYNSLTFIVDADATALFPLTRLDFFGFLRRKKQHNLDYYSEEELAFLNQLYDWNDASEAKNEVLSCLNGGVDEGMIVALSNPNWVAIPSGIPSAFIIGIVCNQADCKDIAIEAGNIFEVPVVDRKGNIISNYQNKSSIR